MKKKKNKESKGINYDNDNILLDFNVVVCGYENKKKKKIKEKQLWMVVASTKFIYIPGS